MGYCAIDFSIPASGQDPDFYDVSGPSLANTRRTAPSCNGASVQIVTASTHAVTVDLDTNYFCGGNFGTMAGSTVPGIVRCKYYRPITSHKKGCVVT